MKWYWIALIVVVALAAGWIISAQVSKNRARKRMANVPVKDIKSVDTTVDQTANGTVATTKVTGTNGQTVTNIRKVG